MHELFARSSFFVPQTALFAELMGMLRVQHSFGCFAEEIAQFLGGIAFERIASDACGLGVVLHCTLCSTVHWYCMYSIHGDHSTARLEARTLAHSRSGLIE